MENNLSRKLSVKRLDTTQTVDITEDFSLPDYIPEVRRVVGVQANAAVDGKYLNGTELEADGNVLYTVMYLGGDGGLCSVPLNGSFNGKIQVKSQEGDSFGADDISLSAAADNVVCRVTAPRRITLSSKVKIRVFSQKKVDCGERIEPAKQAKQAEPAELADSVRLKKEQADYAAVKTLRTTVECGGELREREGTRVICAQGSVMINETKTTSDGVGVSGEGRISLLLLTPDGAYTTAKARCSMDTVLPCDPSDILTRAAVGRCLMCEVETADDGLITWNIECDIDCDTVTGGKSEISTDGYCAHYEDECVFEEINALSAVKGINSRLTVSGTKPIRRDMTYAGGWGKAVFDKAELAGRHLVLSGNAVITAVLCGNDEAVSEECIIPIKYECETDGAAGELTGKCEFTVCDVSGRCDGETLNVTAELGVSGVFLAEKKIRCLTALRPDPDRPIPHKKNIIKICVPGENETEWDIRKRYRLSSDSLKKTGRVYLIQ